ncbi:uncharacterized [Tachysurus ichikawai]
MCFYSSEPNEIRVGLVSAAAEVVPKEKKKQLNSPRSVSGGPHRKTETAANQMGRRMSGAERRWDSWRRNSDRIFTSLLHESQVSAFLYLQSKIFTDFCRKQDKRIGFYQIIFSILETFCRFLHN